MNFIIPYEDSIAKGDGAFITPNNEIILTSSHEIFSYEYCNGLGSYLSGKSDESKSKLTKEQLELYKLWLESNKHTENMDSDFMVYVLGVDKIVTIRKRTILTTTDCPHIKYYNYYLMDWRIEETRKKVYNEATGIFEFRNSNLWINSSGEDRRVKEELDEIKSKVLIKNRAPFLK